MYRVKIVLKNGTELRATATNYGVYEDSVILEAETQTMIVYKSEISYFIITEEENGQSNL